MARILALLQGGGSAWALPSSVTLPIGLTAIYHVLHELENWMFTIKYVQCRQEALEEFLHSLWHRFECVLCLFEYVTD